MKTFECLDCGETFEEQSRDLMAITSTRAGAGRLCNGTKDR